MKNLTPYQFKIPADLLEWLREKAERDHTTVSEILRRGVLLQMREEQASNQQLAG